MWRSFLAEWPKIRRRSVLAAIPAMSVITSLALYAAFIRLPTRGNSRQLIQGAGQSNGLVALMLQATRPLELVVLVTIGAVIGAEWSQGTLRNLLVQEPGRIRMLAGKFLALMLYLLFSAFLAVGIGVLVATLTANHVGVNTSAWWTSDGTLLLVEFCGNLALALIGWSVVTLLAAVLIRSPAGAVGVSLGWLFVVEGLTSVVWPEIGQWMPGNLLQTILKGGGIVIDYNTALLFSAIYVAGMLVVAGASFARRDVTA